MTRALTQDGDGNTATVAQRGIDQDATVNQGGDNNSADIDQGRDRFGGFAGLFDTGRGERQTATVNQVGRQQCRQHQAAR